jgi:hypothetical protein
MVAIATAGSGSQARQRAVVARSSSSEHPFGHRLLAAADRTAGEMPIERAPASRRELAVHRRRHELPRSSTTHVVSS